MSSQARPKCSVACATSTAAAYSLAEVVVRGTATARSPRPGARAARGCGATCPSRARVCRGSRRARRARRPPRRARARRRAGVSTPSWMRPSKRWLGRLRNRRRPSWSSAVLARRRRRGCEIVSVKPSRQVRRASSRSRGASSATSPSSASRKRIQSLGRGVEADVAGLGEVVVPRVLEDAWRRARGRSRRCGRSSRCRRR